MPQLLTVSRAARLVGISRGALQRKIHDNKLKTFEGMVKISDLLRAYPEAKLEDNSTLERVRNIKAQATPSSREQPSLPSPEILASRLTSLSKTLIESQNQQQYNKKLLEQLLKQLQTVKHPETQTIYSWLQNSLSQHQPYSPRKTALLVKDTFLRMLSASIKIIPSGHEFFVEGQQGLLEAALNSGLNINYGCSSGNCGSCKARVISGDYLKVHDHEYIISPTEKNLGYILMCSYTAVTDMIIEAEEAQNMEDIKQQNIQAKIKKITKLNQNLMILQIQTPKTNNLRFMAGQSVYLQLNQQKEQHTVASCPCDGQNLQFHIRCDQQTAFCQQLFQHSQIGDLINIQGPFGEFTLNDNETAPIIFIAQNEGFIELKSLIEQAVSIDRTESIHLYWIVHQQNRHYMNNLCRSWHDALDNFTYIPLTTATNKTDTDTLLNKLTADYPYLERQQIYITGTKNFTETIKTHLKLPNSQYQQKNIKIKIHKKQIDKLFNQKTHAKIEKSS